MRSRASSFFTRLVVVPVQAWARCYCQSSEKLCALLSALSAP